tara:strand:- start:202 stop:507 length:306 start_codon:yes stop_codon:yes gene_type:complete
VVHILTKPKASAKVKKLCKNYKGIRIPALIPATNYNLTGSLTPGGTFFDPPKKTPKATIQTLTKSIKAQITLKKKISKLKEELCDEEYNEKIMRKELEGSE